MAGDTRTVSSGMGMVRARELVLPGAFLLDGLETPRTRRGVILSSPVEWGWVTNAGLTLCV